MGLCLVIPLVDLIGTLKYLSCLLCHDRLLFMIVMSFHYDRVLLDDWLWYDGMHITDFEKMNMSLLLGMACLVMHKIFNG